MYKLECFDENGDQVTHWTCDTQGEIMHRFQNELDEDRANGHIYRYKLYRQAGWVEIPYHMTVSLR